MTAAPINNRVTEITGTDYPIIQAPMSWIARAQLASAVCNAGGMGIICLLYTSPSPRDKRQSRMPSSA